MDELMKVYAAGSNVIPQVTGKLLWVGFIRSATVR